MNRGDNDDFGAALSRDIASYFDLDATEAATHGPPPAKPPAAEPTVTLKAGHSQLSIPEPAFARAWAGAFWAGAPWSNWQGDITQAGVSSLAAAAKRERLYELGTRLEVFGARMGSSAAVVGSDGQPWRPPAKVQLGESRVSDLPAPMSGGPKLVGTGPNPATTPAPTNQVNTLKVATAADVAAYFGGDDDAE